MHRPTSCAISFFLSQCQGAAQHNSFSTSVAVADGCDICCHLFVVVVVVLLRLRVYLISQFSLSLSLFFFFFCFGRFSPAFMSHRYTNMDSLAEFCARSRALCSIILFPVKWTLCRVEKKTSSVQQVVSAVAPNSIKTASTTTTKPQHQANLFASTEKREEYNRETAAAE